MSTNLLRFSLLAVAVAVATACREAEPDNRLRVSGNVEATEVQVAPEVGGRIVELRADEGTRVASGDVVARLDTRDTELQMARARADRGAADAQLRLLQAGSTIQDLRQAQAQIDATEAELDAAGAELQAAEQDLERFEQLLAANAGSQKQRDDAQGRVNVLRERQVAAQARVRGGREVLARLRAGARPEELAGATARVAGIDAQLAVLDEALKDAEVVTPVGGVVTQKLADNGEIVPARGPVLVVTDLDHAWANLFVPEPMIPRIKLGQAATIYTDAGGDGIAGIVSYISPRAEFTPRNVQTADERSRLVYRIKVTVDNRAGVLKQGMPVDAELALP